MTPSKQTLIATLSLAGFISLGGCASTPGALRGHYTAVSPRQAQSGRYLGDTVRWGGIIVGTTPEAHQTCFRVVATPLRDNGEPRVLSQSTLDGRFLACAEGFYDPKLYAESRRITLVGTIDGLQHEKIGGYDYPYPRLQARVVYLWPREPLRAETNTYYPYGWWGPYGAWPWWGFPGWGAPLPYYRYPDPDDRHHDHRHHKPPPPPVEPAPDPIRPAGRPLLQLPKPPMQQPSHRPRPEPPAPTNPPPPAHHHDTQHPPPKPPR